MSILRATLRRRRNLAECCFEDFRTSFLIGTSLFLAYQSVKHGVPSKNGLTSLRRRLNKVFAGGENRIQLGIVIINLTRQLA